ncbi:uncharacterized protein LOC132603896 isoform X1 [Lycium barbarum]|uniref:uncharacterized protein LOC132603896 isoform X1 n=1 Tax=Lycium barbarum TaxID=112863 RepID=UPI00293E571F|nr:uncharacterized protein LOC132603896 isoform X1 [Lycium barbarum]
MMKDVARKNFVLLRTIFLLCSILMVTEAGIGRRELELKQAYASGTKNFDMENDTKFQVDDSIVIDYAPSHQSPDIHHGGSPPFNRREMELKQVYASGTKNFDTENDTKFQVDDSIVIDYSPSHQSPDIHHGGSPPFNRRYHV